MEERIRTIGRTAWWLVGIALAFAVLGLVGWYARVVLAPLVFAGAITFLLNPVVTRLHRRGLPRLVATAAAYAAVAGVVVLAGFAVAPVVTDQVNQLSKDWPDVRADIEERINDLSRESVDNDWPIKVPSVEELEDEVGGGNGGGDENLRSRVTSLGNILGQVFHLGLILILGPIIAFYLLMDLPHIRRVTEEMIPERSHGEVMVIAHRLNLAVGGFFRGQLMVALIVGVMVSAGLLAIGLPAWLIVGMIAGLFNMIPLIGPYVGGVPGVVIALTQRDVQTAVLVVLVMVVAQQIDNHFISPVVMKRAVQLHPAAVMMALLLGGTVGGFFGLLIAVPLAACAKIVIGHLWRKYVLGRSIPGLDEPLPDPASTSGASTGPGDPVTDSQAVGAAAAPGDAVGRAASPTDQERDVPGAGVPVA